MLLLRFVCLGKTKSKTKHVIIFSIRNNWYRSSALSATDDPLTHTLARAHLTTVIVIGSRQRTSALYVVPVAVSLPAGATHTPWLAGSDVLGGAPAPHFTNFWDESRVSLL